MTNEEQIKTLALMIQNLVGGEDKKITGNPPATKKENERFAKFTKMYKTKNLKYVSTTNASRL